QRLGEPALRLLVLPADAMEIALRLCGAGTRDDAAARVRELECAGNERLGFVLFHPDDVDAGQLKRGSRFVILSLGGTGRLEGFLLELLGLRQAACPARNSHSTVERELRGSDLRGRRARRPATPGRRALPH